MLALNNKSSLRLLHADFTNVEHMCEVIHSWDLNFRALAVPAHSSQSSSIIQWRFDSCEITHADFSSSFDQRGASPSGGITFALLAPHIRNLWWRGRDVSAAEVLVFPNGGELHSISGPDFEVFTVFVSEPTIARICEQYELSLTPAHRRLETFRISPELTDELRQQLLRLTNPASPDAHDEAGQLVGKLVDAWLGPMMVSLHRPSSRRRDLALRRCLERLENPDWATLSSAKLCEISGAGERTLQYAFRERFGMTPAAFLKARRLFAARQRLLNSAPGKKTVGDVAASLGFWHLGHFAADYRQAFGETPSETGKRSG